MLLWLGHSPYKQSWYRRNRGSVDNKAFDAVFVQNEEAAALLRILEVQGKCNPVHSSSY